MILTLLYKMRWHAKTVLRHNPTPQDMEREGERRLDEANRTERFLSQLNNDTLDVMHGFGRVNPTLVPPGVLRAAAELRAFFQHYAAAGPELRSQLGTTKRTGGGKAERKQEIAKQAAISLFATALFNLSRAHRDVLVSRLVRAAFDDCTISDRDVCRLRSRFLANRHDGGDSLARRVRPSLPAFT